MTKFDPKEIQNSRRIYKSATPKQDLSWYVKWVSSIFLLMGISVRGVEGFHAFDLICSLVGIAGWLVVGLLWKDRALIILNGVGLALLIRTVFETIL